MKKFRFIMLSFLGLGLVGVLCFFYIYEWIRIPGTIYIENNQEEILSFHSPIKGKLYRIEELNNGEEMEVIAGSGYAKDINLMDTLSLTLREGEHYQAKLKFLGFLPYKTVDIQGVDKKYLYPLGDPIGIYVKINGILVIDTGSFNDMEGREVSPCRYVLEEGDYITAVNGVKVMRKSEFTDIVKNSGGKALKLTVRRNDKTYSFSVQPVKATDGTYKLGIWIRDSLQGIGTMTAMNADGEYVALGHGIDDSDTGEVVDIAYGTLYETSIFAVTNGKKGVPGELNGVIQYSSENILGDIFTNTEQGISGRLRETNVFGELKEPFQIAYKQDVKEGEAWIISDVWEDGQRYKIKITDVKLNTLDNKKGITFEVTDPELLECSGGIVQGMSGSPIIQDGKIIGAVTHVLVNDPTRGYGIFIESMLNHGN